MDSAKRPKLDKCGPVVFAERYDRFCTNCSAVIENAALEKVSEKACSKCYQPVEFRNHSDGNWRRCVRCDSFIRCTFKICFLCARPNVHYDGEKPKRLEKAQLQKFEQLSKVENVGDSQLVLYSPRLGKPAGAKTDRQELTQLTLSSTPILHERFDRFCTGCGSTVENAALEKFIGQNCLRCTNEIEFRVAGDDLWNRCVKCDVFVRCSFKFCYLCGRRNFHYSVDRETQLNKLKFEEFLQQKKLYSETSNSEQSDLLKDQTTSEEAETSVKLETGLDDTTDDAELAAAASKVEDMEARDQERNDALKKDVNIEVLD